MRRVLFAVAAFALVVTGCSDGDDVAPTTTAGPASTTTVVATTTTTTQPPTTSRPPTTTAVPTTTSTTVPEFERIEGVPDELAALIGSPMPDVDLTLDGPEDAARWLEEFETWQVWSSANPSVSPEALGVGYVPDGEPWLNAIEFFDESTLSLRYPWSMEVTDTALEGAPFEQGFGSIFLRFQQGEVYVVTDGELVEVEPPPDPVLVDFALQRDENGQWRLWSREVISS